MQVERGRETQVMGNEWENAGSRAGLMKDMQRRCRGNIRLVRSREEEEGNEN